MKPPNKKPKPAKYTAKTYSEIIRLARLLRQILKIDHRFAPNLLEIFDQLKRFFPKLRLKIVPDFLLPDAEARAYPKHWLIKIRQGIYDGLLRGDARARWTLAHELGHILLQHPRRPFRVRDTNSARPIDPRLEREANIFAREFLVPAHLARNYKTIEELKVAFQISADTAELRLKELKIQEREKLATERFKGPAHKSRRGNDRSYELDHQIAVLCTAISEIVSARSRRERVAVEPLRNNLLGAATLTVTAARLLLDAYESLDRTTTLYQYREVAALVAETIFVRPIREVGSVSSLCEIVRVNEHCAIRAAGALLRISFTNTDDVTLDCPDQSGVPHSQSGYLAALVTTAEILIRSESTILLPTELPDYETYNAQNDICWADVHNLEYLMNFFMLLDSARREEQHAS